MKWLIRRKKLAADAPLLLREFVRKRGQKRKTKKIKKISKKVLTNRLECDKLLESPKDMEA